MGSMIPESVIDDIRDKADIVDVVGEHVRLKRKGGRFWGLCPFHGEKTPSFTVNPERGIYYCFGCGAGGNAFKFLMEHQGLSFPEAVRQLGEKVGVEIPESGGAGPSPQRRQARDAYFEATDLAQRFFRAMLTSGRYAAPLDYLNERGIDAETAEKFGLGYAPDAWSALVDALGKRGVPSKVLEHAGLAQAQRSGDGHIDRFRHRVMFPISSLSQKVLAFSGRALSAEERAKYVNSPETEFYTKGHELFGLNVAHKGIRAAGAAVLVEGNFDVVSLHARGLDHVCAPLGTALTERQARLLKRYTDRVILLFDADNAGQAAATKALSVLLAADIPEVLYGALPDGTDPDDFVRSEGADALRTLLDKARPMLEVRLNEAIAPAAGQADPTLKRVAADHVAQLLSPLPDGIVRKKYISEAARRLELPETDFAKHVAAGRAPMPTPPPPTDEPPSIADGPVVRAVRPFDAHESTLVDVLAARPDLLEVIYREEIHHVIGHPELSDFIETAAVSWTTQGEPTFREASEACEDVSLRKQLLAAMVADRGLTDAAWEDAFYDTTRSLKTRWLKQEMRRVAESLRAEQDFDGQLHLMERQRLLAQHLAELQSAGQHDGHSSASA